MTVSSIVFMSQFSWKHCKQVGIDHVYEMCRKREGYGIQVSTWTLANY